ncbi:down syndrome critical region protein 3 [Salpingoeca rosetta]|uniref:Vacuolar protein sorting-associated protein 26C n=1 Tax=Salpingoeca rosetta (strain ATCC 50818 / BSB-021) TaxID=946362 RepID=F2U9Z5_SALR5|nr:down syndrome critical region protein 3 [Salpingoeca rosetta]EGD73570.1 down syndrome critical region protein 3 [Salpingoeca rosetta]|eukprot:XP_004993852.1 down syndrome critical region protein 3 [Salpingoeca rosetta]
MSMSISFSRSSKKYREGELLRGTLNIDSKGLSYNGISLYLEGSVSLQLSAKNVGLFEAFYNSIKPVQLISASLDLRKAGKLNAGVTSIPFEIPLKAKPGQKLYETYHGVFISIQYVLRAELKRSAFSKDLQTKAEFFVEALAPRTDSDPVKFSITPESLDNAKTRADIPKFLIDGHIDHPTCDIAQPFTGEIVVRRSELPIKSIELQLVRVETCGCAEGYASDPTEIQNIQVAEGDVARDFAVPLYMTFPRLFTCPSLLTPNFKIEFEVNLVVVFVSGDVISENFPVKLLRHTPTK